MLRSSSTRAIVGMSLLSEVERGTATGGAFDSPVLKPGTFYQPALQAGLKCDDDRQKHMRFPEVPNPEALAAVDGFGVTAVSVGAVTPYLLSPL